MIFQVINNLFVQSIDFVKRYTWKQIVYCWLLLTPLLKSLTWH